MERQGVTSNVCNLVKELPTHQQNKTMEKAKGQWFPGVRSDRGWLTRTQALFMDSKTTLYNGGYMLLNIYTNTQIVHSGPKWKLRVLSGDKVSV